MPLPIVRPPEPKIAWRLDPYPKNEIWEQVVQLPPALNITSRTSHPTEQLQDCHNRHADLHPVPTSPHHLLHVIEQFGQEDPQSEQHWECKNPPLPHVSICTDPTPSHLWNY